MIRSNSQFLSEKNKSPLTLAKELGVGAGKNRQLSKSNFKNTNPGKGENNLNTMKRKESNTIGNRANINMENINYVTITNSSNRNSPGKKGGNNIAFGTYKNALSLNAKPLIVKSNVPVNIGIGTKNKNKQNLFNSSNKTSQKKTQIAKPSDKYTKIKSSDPFAGGQKHKTNFGYVYSAGGIPCRIQHGSVKLKLKWDIEPESKIIIDL